MVHDSSGGSIEEEFPIEPDLPLKLDGIRHDDVTASGGILQCARATTHDVVAQEEPGLRIVREQVIDGKRVAVAEVEGRPAVRRGWAVEAFPVPVIPYEFPAWSGFAGNLSFRRVRLHIRVHVLTAGLER